MSPDQYRQRGAHYPDSLNLKDADWRIKPGLMIAFVIAALGLTIGNPTYQEPTTTTPLGTIDLHPITSTTCIRGTLYATGPDLQIAPGLGINVEDNLSTPTGTC